MNIETINTNTIEAIISRNEILQLLDENKINKNKLALISISEPFREGYEDEALNNQDVEGFADSIRVKFWDIEEDFGDYKIISNKIAKDLQDFILKNIDKRFLIHCKAGQSRSAGVGKAVECIKFFGIGEKAKYNYQTGFSSEIDKHIRYFPNLTVFEKIVAEYKKDNLC